MSHVKLRPPKNRIEKRVTILWVLQALAFGLPLAAGVVVGYVFLDETQYWWLHILAVVVLGMLIIGVSVEPWIRYKVHRWEVTDEAVYGLSGWFVREWRVAPISRIQTVDAVRGPIEQLLGLSTLRITTASAKGAIEINGLDKDVAAKVAEDLTIITEKTPGDAT